MKIIINVKPSIVTSINMAQSEVMKIFVVNSICFFVAVNVEKKTPIKFVPVVKLGGTLKTGELFSPFIAHPVSQKITHEKTTATSTCQTSRTCFSHAVLARMCLISSLISKTFL